MRLADAHVHLFEQGFVAGYGDPWAWRDELELYEAIRAVHGIERSLVVGYEGTPRYEGNNAFLARVAASRPWITALAYHAALLPPGPEEVHGLRAGWFRGVAVYATAEEEAGAVAEWPAETLEALSRSASIVSLNVSAGVVSALDRFFEALDGATVMLSHLGLPGQARSWPARDGREVLAPVLRAARFPNVGVKVSGLYAVSDPPHGYPHREAWPLLEALRDAFGPTRLCWGSDFPPALQAVSFAQTLDVLDHLDWPRADIEAVMGRNLLAVLEATESR